MADGVKYRYRGDDPELQGCVAYDSGFTRFTRSGFGPFRVKNDAYRAANGSYELVRTFYYTSWVGFLRDWIRIR